MKRILLLISALLIVQFTQAQKLITFGPIIGVTTSTLDNSKFSGNSPGVGYMAGGFFRADIKKWYLQPNVYYMNNESSFEAGPICRTQLLKYQQIKI